MAEDVLQFIQKQKTAFIVSTDAEGFPHIKAMEPRLVEGLKNFYFSTNISSLRVSHYRSRPQASLYFYRKGPLNESVVLFGEMAVLEDPASKKKLWRERDTLFYPQGAEDPGYCVLKFTALRGAYSHGGQSHDFMVE